MLHPKWTAAVLLQAAAAANIDVLEDVDLILPAATFCVLRLPSVPLLRGRPLLVKALAEDLRADEKSGAVCARVVVALKCAFHSSSGCTVRLGSLRLGPCVAGGASSEKAKRGEKKKGSEGKSGPGLRLLLGEFLRPVGGKEEEEVLAEEE